MNLKRILGLESEPVSEWWQLGKYNAEVARGIVHTEEWKAKMMLEQARFDGQMGRKIPGRPVTKYDYELNNGAEASPTPERT